MPVLMSLPHGQVLDIAGEFKISAYDARFVAPAKQLGVKPITEDAKLRAASPARTRSLSQAIA